jgi:hypothetical protein
MAMNSHFSSVSSGSIEEAIPYHSSHGNNNRNNNGRQNLNNKSFTNYNNNNNMSQLHDDRMN